MTPTQNPHETNSQKLFTRQHMLFRSAIGVPLDVSQVDPNCYFFAFLHFFAMIRSQFENIHNLSTYEVAAVTST
jgi:hypothetical protein